MSFLTATLAGFALHDRVRPSTQYVLTWDIFAACLLFLAWIMIMKTPQQKLRARAQEQDLSRTIISFFVITAACAALFAVGFLFFTNRSAQQSHFVVHLLISLFAVISAWMLVHTVFGLRYAHTYYGDRDDSDESSQHAGGLEFPGDRLPDYMDFAYFSFVIGMTFQVSDVEITSREIRRLALFHGMLSFAFNTVILALTINTVSSMI
jgi:uncharacterized membrane protein